MHVQFMTENKKLVAMNKQSYFFRINIALMITAYQELLCWKIELVVVFIPCIFISVFIPACQQI